jgi:hypothetical protein
MEKGIRPPSLKIQTWQNLESFHPIHIQLNIVLFIAVNLILSTDTMGAQPSRKLCDMPALIAILCLLCINPLLAHGHEQVMYTEIDERSISFKRSHLRTITANDISQKRHLSSFWSGILSKCFLACLSLCFTQFDSSLNLLTNVSGFLSSNASIDHLICPTHPHDCHPHIPHPHRREL